MGAAENAVTKAVRAACVLRGAMVVRVQAGSHMVGKHFVRGAEAGTADLIGCYRGRAIALEVKTAKGKQQESQIEWERWWIISGGKYGVVRSGFDTLQVLNAIDDEIEAQIIMEAKCRE